MSYAFITGIPAAGKSHLAAKMARATGALHVEIDALKEEMTKNLETDPWVNFFLNKDEEEYWRTTSPKEDWENLEKQSEAFWPHILKKINEVVRSEETAIFEGVNILPHLASRDLKFSGVVLLGASFEEVFERNKKEPRWGKTEVLQRREAEAFFYDEGPRYRREAKQYGFKTFSDPMSAEKELLRLMDSE